MQVLRSSGTCPNGKDCPNVARSDVDRRVLLVQGNIVNNPAILAEIGDVPDGEFVVAIPANLIPEIGGGVPRVKS